MNHVPALVISPRDNVATALEPLAAGPYAGHRRVQSITIAEATPQGHKIALRPYSDGRRHCYKYGSTDRPGHLDIEPGRTCTRITSRAAVDDRHRTTRKNTRSLNGKATSPDGPRLAEPPDKVSGHG